MFTVAGRTDEAKPETVKFGESSLKVDDEQLASFEKIIQLLISGGYFRAMITTLEPFDKVAGGLAWSITSANENVDISLLLDEHSRMGEKVLAEKALTTIKLTSLEMSENIEGALVSMKCPYPLQAQQILHLDCINIFPVVQWLVEHLLEVRKATGDVVRLYSERQFSQMNYKLPEDEQAELRKPNALHYLEECEERYAVKREHRMKKRPRYLRSTRRGMDLEDERVHTVLLEYGQAHLYTMALLHKNEEDKKKKAKGLRIKIPGADGDDAERKEKDAKMADARGKKILQAMGIVQGDDVTSSVMNNILTGKSSEIGVARDVSAAELQEAASLQNQANSKEHGEFDHLRYMQDVEKRIAKAEAQLQLILKMGEERKAELDKLSEIVAKKVNYNQRIIDETEKLKNQEQTPENKKNLEILQGMVAMREELKTQTEQFKENVKKQRGEWEEKKRALTEDVPDDDYEMVMSMWVKDTEKLEKAREHFAAKNRAVAAVKRKIDAIPSRRELQQYQKQFVEVHEQMAVKYMETKQYYNLYNSNREVKKALEHERELLDSIRDGFLQVKGSVKGREKFAESMSKMVEGMERNLEIQNTVHQKSVAERNNHDEQYITLIEKERQYYNTAKQFQEECKKTEEWETRLSKLKKRKK